jgi:hypothetical protein
MELTRMCPILFLLIWASTATDLQQNLDPQLTEFITFVSRIRTDIKSLIIDYLDRLEYCYFYHAYPEFLEKYDGMHAKYEIQERVFFFPAKDLQWEVRGITMKRDENLTTLFETELTRLESRLVEQNIFKFRDIYKKLHQAYKENTNFNLKICKLKQDERVVLQNSLTKLFDEYDHWAEDRKIGNALLQKFLTFVNGIGDNEKDASDLMFRALLYINNLENFKFLLRCVKKTQFCFNMVLWDCAQYGTFDQMKACVEIAGKDVLHKKCTSDGCKYCSSLNRPTL